MSQPNSTYTPQLVTADGVIKANDWTLITDEDPIGAQSTLSFARALKELDGLNGYYGVRILPGDDVRQLAPFIDKIKLIEVAFPGFRDGRGFSTARILREGMKYQGTIRAVGDVLRDLTLHMLRCGFDELELKDADPVGAVKAAKARFEYVYQGAADGREPVWALRHR
jgi:uncharacterized protein (DUF934 family)